MLNVQKLLIFIKLMCEDVKFQKGLKLKWKINFGSMYVEFLKF